MRDRGVIHSPRAHAHTYTSLTGLSSLLSQASLVLSVLLKRKKARGREGGRQRKDVREGVRRVGEEGEGKRRQVIWVSCSMQSHLPTCPTFFCLGKRVKRAQLLCTVILVSSSSTLPLFNCILRILLILLLLGHINTHPLPPHSSCVHPSPPPWGLPQWVGSSLSVCWWLHLEQMWCSAAVSLLCSTLPTPHTSAPPSYLPTLTSLCLPLQCLLCSYLSTCLFVPTLLKRKLASLILLSDVFFCFFLPSSSLTSLSNLLHFPAFLDAAVNVQST